MYSPNANAQTFIDRYSGWTGLNDRTLDIAIKPTELSYIRNANYDNCPYITKREGYDKHTNFQIASDRMRGLFSYYKTNSTSYLAALTNQNVYDATNGCWTGLKSGLSILDIEYDAVTFRDNLLITSNSDAVITYDGTTVSDLGGSPPLGAYIESHAFRVFLSGNSTNPLRVYASKVLDETIWDTVTEKDVVAAAADPCYFDIPAAEGEKITALAVLLDSLVIFTENEIFILLDAWGNPASDWVLKRASVDVGCASNKSIAKVRNELFFVSNKGVQTFSGATTTITYSFDDLKAFSLSDRIKGTFESLNQDKLYLSCGVNFDDKYWLAVCGSGSGYNDLVLVFDYVVGEWTVYDGIYANYFCVYNNELYFGDSRNYAFIYKWGGVYYDGDIQAPSNATGTQCTHSLQDTTQNWQSDQFKGCRVHLYCGAGEGQTRTIITNNSNTLVVDTAWSVMPVSGTTLYCIGGIEMVVDTGFLPMKDESGNRLLEIYKEWIDVFVQAKAVANDTYYLKLFFDVDQTGWSPAFAVDMNNDYDDYGTKLWGEASYAGKDLITKKVNLSRYKAIGKYIKVRYYNYRPNERITIYNTVFTYKPSTLTETEIKDR